MEQQKSLVPAQAEIRAISVESPRDVLARASEMARALVEVVSKARGLEVSISGRRYLRVEAWMTIAAFHGTSVVVESVERQEDAYVARASVLSRDGRVVSRAEASCSRDEPAWKDKPDYMLRSMAQTRAAAKALRVAYAYVPVLAGYEATPAEELQEAEHTDRPRPHKPTPAGGQATSLKSSALSRFSAALKEHDWPDDRAKLVWQVLWPDVQRWRDLTPHQQEVVSQAADLLIRLIQKHGVDPARELLRELLPPSDLLTGDIVRDAVSSLLRDDAARPI